MKKLWSLLALVLTLVILIGSYAYVKNKPKKETPEEPTVEKEQILKVDKEKITKMVLTSATGELVLEKKGTEWVVPGVNSKLNQDLINEIADSFSNMQAEKLIEENPKDLEKYGLKKPAVTAKAILQGGEEKVVYLGDKTLVGSTYYLMLKDLQKVYTVWVNHGEHFNYTLESLRDKTLTNEVDFSSLTYLKISPQGEPEIEIKTSEASSDSGQEYGLNIFTMYKPYKIPRSVDTEKVDAVIKAIPEISVVDVVEENAKDLSKYGLDKPTLQVIAKDKENHTFHIQIGKEKGDSLVYFKLADSNNVYTTEKEKAKALKPEPFTLIAKFAYIVNIDDVDKIDIQTKDKNYAITLTRQLTKKAEKEGEKDEYAVTYKINDKEIKEEDFKKYYQSLIGLTADAENDKNIEQKAELTTTYYLNKGNTKVVKVEYSPYNADFYSIFRDGNSEFLISKSKVSKMLSDLENLIK
jgi:ribosome biogenesis protein Nip4